LKTFVLWRMAAVKIPGRTEPQATLTGGRLDTVLAIACTPGFSSTETVIDVGSFLAGGSFVILHSATLADQQRFCRRSEGDLTYGVDLLKDAPN